METQFKRIKNLPGETYQEKRTNVLKKKEVKKNAQSKRIIAPIDLKPILPNISQVFNKHYKSMIFKKPELKGTFSDPAMPALRQPPAYNKGRQIPTEKSSECSRMEEVR